MSHHASNQCICHVTLSFCHTHEHIYAVALRSKYNMPYHTRGIDISGVYLVSVVVKGETNTQLAASTPQEHSQHHNHSHHHNRSQHLSHKITTVTIPPTTNTVTTTTVTFTVIAFHTAISKDRKKTTKDSKNKTGNLKTEELKK